MYLVCKLKFSSALLFRLFRIKVHNNFAQANDVFAEDAVVESTDGPIDASAIRKRIYSGILEGRNDTISNYLSSIRVCYRIGWYQNDWQKSVKIQYIFQKILYKVNGHDKTDFLKQRNIWLLPFFDLFQVSWIKKPGAKKL